MAAGWRGLVLTMVSALLPGCVGCGNSGTCTGKIGSVAFEAELSAKSTSHTVYESAFVGTGDTTFLHLEFVGSPLVVEGFVALASPVIPQTVVLGPEGCVHPPNRSACVVRFPPYDPDAGPIDAGPPVRSDGGACLIECAAGEWGPWTARGLPDQPRIIGGEFSYIGGALFEVDGNLTLRFEGGGELVCEVEDVAFDLLANEGTPSSSGGGFDD